MHLVFCADVHVLTHSSTFVTDCAGIVQPQAHLSGSYVGHAIGPKLPGRTALKSTCKRGCGMLLVVPYIFSHCDSSNGIVLVCKVLLVFWQCIVHIIHNKHTMQINKHIMHTTVQCSGLRTAVQHITREYSTSSPSTLTAARCTSAAPNHMGMLLCIVRVDQARKTQQRAPAQVQHVL